MYGGFDAHALTPFLQALTRAQDTAV